MWRSSALATLLVLAAAAPSPAQLCLPPLYEDGSRLIAPGEARVLWLEPLLRQHEVCWRRPATADEARVLVIGSSGIFGYPHAAPETAVAAVNRSFETSGTPAHLFNLGMVWTYGPKDALILHESLRFGPDVIVYAVTLDDFFHRSPSGVPSVDSFFLANSRAVDRAASAGIPSIGEAFERYRVYWSDDAAGEPLWRSLRESGRLARVSARQIALRARAAWVPGAGGDPLPREESTKGYDCEDVKRFASYWIDWQDWNLLPWLAELQRTRGTRVLVVNWPVAGDPAGECFNSRYLAANFADYNAWLERETGARGLAYLDLHDALRADQFVDSIHPNADGQRAVAARLEAALRPLLPAAGGSR
jgi:hypothetical protein